MKDLVLIGDTETDGLNPTLIHVAAYKSYPDGEWFVFRQEECYGEEHKNLLKRAKYVIGHNFIGYDLPRVFRRFVWPEMPVDKIKDTLIMSRMMNADRPGGHGLESWGEQLGVLKPEIDDWSTFSEAMVDRVLKDVEINYRLYEKLRKEFKTTEKALKIEHYTQYHLDRMEEYGFWFDLPKADAIYSDVCIEELRLLEQLQKDFPPRAVKNDEVQVKVKIVKKKFIDENGEPIKVTNPVTGRLIQKTEEVQEKYILTKNKIPLDDVWGNFTFVEWEKFNPGSPEQAVVHLNAAGWQPTVKTKGHIKAERAKMDLERDLKRTKNSFKREKINQELDLIKIKLEKYKIFGWAVSDEENLDTIPEDAPDSIKNIKHYLVVRNRKLRMEEWYGALGSDQRVHGGIIGIGAKTHRCAHRKPNMANVPAIKKKGKINYLGAEYRSVWGVPPIEIIRKGVYDHIYKTREERCIVGVDAEGIQLRILCHLMGDEEYTRQVLSGDPHSYNMFAAGIDPGFPVANEKMTQLMLEKFGREVSVDEALELRLGNKDGFDWSGRDVAKTFIYAFLLGAGNGKILQITGIPGAQLKERFFEEIPALYELQEVFIPGEIAKGYTLGLDGRRFSLDRIPKHKVLSILLQGGEAVVMKLALHFIMTEIYKRNLDAFPVAFVHDEFQIDSAVSCAEEIKLIATSAIKRAGEYLNLKCPMAGSGRVGINWKETH